jgi:hypothetical protein
MLGGGSSGGGVGGVSGPGVGGLGSGRGVGGTGCGAGAGDGGAGAGAASSISRSLPEAKERKPVPCWYQSVMSVVLLPARPWANPGAVGHSQSWVRAEP